jgi:hypothetical protein
MTMATLTQIAARWLARALAVLAGWLLTTWGCIARSEKTRHDGRMFKCNPARLALTAVLALGLAFSPGFVQASHCPDSLAAAEVARHAALAVDELSDHGHSHEDGEANEQGPGHLHGHDPADHSHQLAFTVPDGLTTPQPVGRSWLMHSQTALRLGPDMGFERPPKRVLSI